MELNTFSSFVHVKGSDVTAEFAPGPTRTDEVAVPTDPNASFGPEGYPSCLEDPFLRSPPVSLPLPSSNPRLLPDQVTGLLRHSLHRSLRLCINMISAELCYWEKDDYRNEHLFLEENLEHLSEKELVLFRSLPHRHTVVKDKPIGIYRSNTQ